MSSNKGSSNFSGAPPKYINDFSKALASEVRILLAEVGQLRDERRQLQYEIAELMAVKSKHGAGGEYSPEWRPPAPEPPAPEPAPPPPIDDGPPQPARPGWRTVHQRPNRRDRALKMKPATPAPPAPAPLPIEAPKPNLPAWAQWRPNPSLAPELPASAPTTLTVQQPRGGLFGPPTPPPK